MAQHNKLVKYIEIEDFKRVLRAEKDKRFKLAYVLAMGSGLRMSEILGPAPNSNQQIQPLTKDQVNLETHQIKILGKGNKERITCTSPWLNKSNINLLPLKINRRTLHNRFSKVCKEVLGKHHSFHNLRHGFANYMVNEKNVPLSVVQSLLGHSRLDTTGIYTKANPKRAVMTAWEVFE